MSKTLIHITDHGLLRWLERVAGVDMEAARREIQAAIRPGVAADGRLGLGESCGVRVGGALYVIRDRSLVTVMPSERMFTPKIAEDDR